MCKGCVKAKAKAKSVKSETSEKADKPRECLFVDSSGPCAKSLGNDWHWGKTVDNFSGMSWDDFVKNKNDFPGLMDNRCAAMKNLGHNIKHVHCDNAGENSTALQCACAKHGIELERAAPNVPQFNGCIERGFVIDEQGGSAMMFSADSKEGVRNSLWPHAAQTKSSLHNVACNARLEENDAP